MNRAFSTFGTVILVAAFTAGAGCKKNSGASGGDAGGDASDGGSEPMAVACPAVDGGPEDDGGADAGTLTGVDEFGPNAPASRTSSSLGRVNIYEVTSPSTLERVDIYLQADLPRTRLTVAVQESVSRTAAFSKVADIQIDFGVCRGWASSGPLAIPLRVGRFYAMGFDPNQVVTPFVSMDSDSLPTDGMFGRLIGSRTATSVSVPTLNWDKFMDKEYNRQRLVTSPRTPDDLDVTPVDAGADGSKDSASVDGATNAGGDAAAGDAGRDSTALDGGVGLDAASGADTGVGTDGSKG